MNVGDTYQLEIGFEPSNANEGYYFYSDNENVLTVSDSGLVTAIGEGSTDIYVIGNEEEVWNYITVEVVDEQNIVLVESMSISDSQIDIAVGDTYQLTASVSPSNATYNEILWFPYDSNVISISASGLVTALSTGQTYAVAYTQEFLNIDDSNAYAYCTVNVVESIVPATSISLSETNVWMSVGDPDYEVEVTISPSNATNKTVLWSSSDASVATVDNEGMIHAVNEGMCYVTATCASNLALSASCSVYVFGTNDYLDPNILSDDNDILTPDSTDSSALYGVELSASSLNINSVSYKSNFTKKYDSSGHSIGLYRYGLNSSTLILRAGYDNAPAAIYNIDAYYGIRMLTVSYSASANFNIEFGNGLNYYSANVTIKSGNNQSVNLYLADNDYSFFRVNGVASSDMIISSVQVRYENDSSIYTKTTKDRISEPSKGFYMGQYDREEGDQYVMGGKTYVYHSHQYVLSQYYANPSSFDPTDYSYTSAVDVANYFCIFNAWPANFFSVSSSSDGAVSHWYDGGSVYTISNSYRSIFGDYTRQVSEYDRTNGYATTVPYKKYGSTNAPRYYEFDIDIDGTYSTSRGVGRVVGFCNGFTCYDNNLNVCLFTDDHYVSFRECLNNGTWGERFSGNSNNVEYVNRQYWC